jgi:hypothetical protein
MMLGTLEHNEATPHPAPTDDRLFRALKYISAATDLKDESAVTRWLIMQDTD